MNIDYPKEMRYTFEAIQTMFSSLALSAPSAQGLKAFAETLNVEANLCFCLF